MKPKRFFIAFLISVLTLTLVTACSSDEKHVHTASSVWDCDAAEHWQLCECGETMNVSAHVLNDGILCEICHSEIWDYGDGVYDVYTYNENGDQIRGVSCTADGKNVWEIEYDADGNRTCEKSYENGTLTGETLYALDADGSAYEVKMTLYQEDGYTGVHEYNENCDLVSYTGYDANGNKVCEYLYEYAADADGNTYNVKTTECNYESQTIYISEFNAYGDQVGRTICDLDGNVQIRDRFECGYNDEGEVIWRKDYTNDVLVRELTGYRTVVEEDSTMTFPDTIIDYYEDGTKRVSVNGDYGMVVSETYYKADGTVERVRTYTYETDADGNWTRIMVYENDCLITDTEYSLDADGWSYPSKVTEYNENGGIVKETRYDVDGNEIQ